MADDDIPDMPADGAARYRVMVAEKQRVEALAAALRGQLLVAQAEVAVLRRALGPHAAATATSARSTT